MRKLPQKKQWDQRNAGRTRRQPSNCLLSPEQQEMRRSAFQFTIAIPKMWFGHPPPTARTHRAQQAVQKGGLPKDEPIPASVSTGAHAYPAPMFAWRPCPPDAHAHPTSLFCQALMLTWYSCLTRYSREIAAAHTVHGLQELIPHGKNRTACMISRLPT